ncbi:acyl-CoA dehydrogenase [Lichenihabitans psoromatis]|uniref:acyl-CoA dehydrogenase n=1 Tax=Lichenihabitans psoromatis TaxID=2528642 RepID=UPI001038306B|nr:acyl-CoA dehydrogenase [Lichenihabitans psoromatis]
MAKDFRLLSHPDSLERIPLDDGGRRAGPLDAVLRATQLSDLLFKEGEQADRETRITDRVHAALRASRLLLAPFPARWGGEDLLSAERSRDLTAVLRLIGAGDLSVARLYEGHVNAVALVTRFGTSGQVAAFADAVAQGAMSAVWNAEGKQPLRAQRTAAGWHLTGSKILASGAGSITHPIVTPTGPDGVIMVIPVLASGERADLSGWTAQGVRSTATGTVDFTGLTIPFAAQIGGAGDYMRQPSFSGGAWRFCAVHLGAAERLLDLYREHLVSRSRDGDALQQQRVAHCAAALGSAAFWVEHAAARLASHSSVVDAVDAEATVGFVNLTRIVTERACLDVLEAVHRGIGLGAFIRPHAVERVSRDLSTYLRQPVPDGAMLDAAKMVLASPRSTRQLWDL